MELRGAVEEIGEIGVLAKDVEEFNEVVCLGCVPGGEVLDGDVDEVGVGNNER